MSVGRKGPKERMDTLVPPEGVPIGFRVAGLPVRMAAQLVDLILPGLAIAVLFIFLALLQLPWRMDTYAAIFLLLFFFVRIPYYILAEIAWNGQTIGKRLMKIRVISADGRTLTTHAIVVRNLLKEAEVFLPGTLLLGLESLSGWWFVVGLGWIAATIAVPLFNTRRQRLGDLIGGTFVIHQPEPLLMPDLARQAPVDRARERFGFLPHQLDHYGAYELQTLETLLRAQGRHADQGSYDRNRARLAGVVDRIRAKIEYAEAVEPEDHEAFLRAFYNAQRAHLEQRQIFGEKRADKFHRGKEPGEDDRGLK
ncbi:MAG: RDD family protein [Rubricella sp.]